MAITKKTSYLGFEFDNYVKILGTSVSDILAKGKVVLSQYEITNLSNNEVVNYLRKWTTLEEVAPNKFPLRDAYTDPEGNEKLAEYIDLN